MDNPGDPDPAAEPAWPPAEMPAPLGTPEMPGGDDVRMEGGGDWGAAPEAPPAMPAAGAGRRRSPALLGWVAGAVVVAAVAAIGTVAATSGGGPPRHPTPPAPAAVNEVTHVPASVLDEVGVAGTSVASQPGGNPLAVMKGPAVRGDGLAAVGNRPVVFYFGALWCPYCATERWSLIVALSRFGTFTGLSSAVSSSTDVYPDTQTWSFHGASYTSQYIVFAPVEYQDENRAPLDQLNSADLAVLNRWDPGGSFPFLTIGSRFTGGLPPWLSPQLLQGRTQEEIAAALAQPQDEVGAGIDANANYLTAGICAVDGGAPAGVCGSAGVQSAAKLLPRLPAAQPAGS